MPETKKECNAERAADVMGPVDRGDLMIAKKGDIRVPNSSSPISRIESTLSIT